MLRCRHLVIGLACLACTHRARPPLDLGGTTFEGVYTAGFEVSEFRPCNSPELWWVESVDETPIGLAAWDALQKGGEQADPAPPGGRTRWPRAYVVVRGDTTPRGRHGHLGAYDRTLYLRAVTRLRPAPQEKCPDAKR